MEIMLAIMMALAVGSIWDEVVEPDQPPSELSQEVLPDPHLFWPPDMIPHPTLPGEGSSGREDREMA